MSLFKSAGSTIKVSANAPATADVAGFSALSFTKLGQVESISEFGVERETIKFVPLDTGIAQKVVGSADSGTPDVTVALDTDDAGQVIMKAGANSDNPLSFEVTSKQGDKYYFQAIVKKWKVNINDASGITKATTSLDITGSIVESLA
jgi:hypothetical protein